MSHLHEVGSLPQPYGAILEAMQAAENLSAARHRRVEQLADAIKELHVENGELRDAILALTNRLEMVTRLLLSRLLAEDCLACNRTVFQPMCDLCADMEQAEETATERTPDRESDRDD